MAKAYTKEQVQFAVSKSESYSDVFRNLGVKINGGSYVWIKRLVSKFEIDVSHFLSPSEIATRVSLSNKIARDKNTKDISNDNGSRINASRLQNFMMSNGLEYRCSCCGLNEWMSIPIRLDIDHIDNNCYNNNILNLQFLCPNCHRQKTITFISKTPKNKKKHFQSVSHIKKPSNTCVDCGADINTQSKKCKSCSKKGLFKIAWPCKEELSKLVWEIPTFKLAKQLGVSDAAVAKRCKLLNIDKPSPGYWRKVETNTI